MDTVLEVLAIGALVTVAMAIRSVAKSIRNFELPDVEPPPPRRYPTMFVPLHCGRAAEYAGLTEPCGRRTGHQGRCMSEEEIQHVADCGMPIFRPTVELRPATSGDDDLRANVAELTKHVADIPASLMTEQTEDEQAWVSCLCLLATRMNRGIDWGGETRENDVGTYR